jgi:hypothetical protein
VVRAPDPEWLRSVEHKANEFLNDLDIQESMYVEKDEVLEDEEENDDRVAGEEDSVEG